MDIFKRRSEKIAQKDIQKDSLQTIAILLDPAKLENPDLDLIYVIPETLETMTDKAILNNGYDYISGYKKGRNDLLALFLHTGDAQKGADMIWDIFQKKQFMGNHLCESAEVFISETETDDFFSCKKVYPADMR